MRADRSWAAMLALVCGACVDGLLPAGPDAAPLGDSDLGAIYGQILSGRCMFASCHSGERPAAQLGFERDELCRSLVSAPSCLFSGRLLVVPEKPDQSVLLGKLLGTTLGQPVDGPCAGASNQRMPYGGEALSAADTDLVRTWIESGAPCDSQPVADAGPDRTDGGTEVSDAGTEVSDAGAGLDAAERSPGLRSIGADATTLLAGSTARALVRLNEPAPAGGAVISIEVGDASALAAPGLVFVAGAADRAEFEVLGKRPTAAVALIAHSGDSRVQTSLRVTGLEVDEVLYDVDGADDGREWIKLRNAGSVAIDLSHYSVGAGRFSYAYTSLALDGVLEPGGCWLIGGPISDPANGAPTYDRAIDLAPDLPNGSGQAKGFGLFEGAPADIEASIPLDAMLVGANNEAGLPVPEGLGSDPQCGDVAAGHSVRRVALDLCADNAAPTPNDCARGRTAGGRTAR